MFVSLSAVEAERVGLAVFEPVVEGGFGESLVLGEVTAESCEPGTVEHRVPLQGRVGNPRRDLLFARPVGVEGVAVAAFERTSADTKKPSSGTGGIRTPEPFGRPLSRRVQSSALPPFRRRG